MFFLFNNCGVHKIAFLKCKFSFKNLNFLFSVKTLQLSFFFQVTKRHYSASNLTSEVHVKQWTVMPTIKVFRQMNPCKLTCWFKRVIECLTHSSQEILPSKQTIVQI